jgi:hypothetical protein
MAIASQSLHARARASAARALAPPQGAFAELGTAAAPPHQPLSRFACALCRRDFLSQEQLDAHMRSNSHAVLQYVRTLKQGNAFAANATGALAGLTVSQLADPLAALEPGRCGASRKLVSAMHWIG